MKMRGQNSKALQNQMITHGMIAQHASYVAHAQQSRACDRTMHAEHRQVVQTVHLLMNGICVKNLLRRHKVVTPFNMLRTCKLYSPVVRGCRALHKANSAVVCQHLTPLELDMLVIRNSLMLAFVLY